jgi:hypothetical protein
MVYMVRSDILTDVVRRALDAWPLSRRELAVRSGIPNTTLVKIAGGQLGASEEVARRLLIALDAWRADHGAAVKNVEAASRPLRRELRRAETRPRAGAE